MGRTSASAGFASWSQMQGSYRGLSQLILRFGFSGLPEKKKILRSVRDSTEAVEHVYIIWGLVRAVVGLYRRRLECARRSLRLSICRCRFFCASSGSTVGGNGPSADPDDHTTRLG